MNRPAADRGAADLASLSLGEEARAPRRVRHWGATLLVAVLLACGAAAAVWLGPRALGVEVEAAAVAADAAVSRDVLLTASGYVTPRRRATVAAKITGRVVEVLAEEGMEVAAAQLLARLDDADAKVQLATAEADRDVAAAAAAELDVNLAEAERELYRVRQLSDQGASTEQELDRAQFAVQALRARVARARQQVAAAEAQVAVARQNVDNCTVRAPFAGVVVSKDAQPGEMVSPISAGSGFTRTGIATIVDMASLEIEVDVNESYLARVSVGQPVRATLDAWPDWQIPGRVRTVIPTADRQKATVKVRVTFEALDPRILPDMGVKVAFLGQDEAPAGLIRVPAAALREAAESPPFVFRLREGRLERVAVQIGQRRDGDVEVTAGLRPGDLVVINGPASLRDGQRVRVRR